MHEIKEDGRYIEFHVTGTLTDEDSDTIISHLEQRVHTYGKLRLLIVIKDFAGLTPGAIWANLKFHVRHMKNIERMAIVGDKPWEKWMATAANFIATCEVKCFDLRAEEAARTWAKGNM